MRETLARPDPVPLPSRREIERKSLWRVLSLIWIVVAWIGFMAVHRRVPERYQALVTVTGILIAFSPRAALDSGWRQHLRVAGSKFPAFLFAAWVFPLAQPHWSWLVAMVAAYLVASAVSVRRQNAIWPYTICSVAMIAICTWWYVEKL